MELLDLKRLTGGHLIAFTRVAADAPLPEDAAVLLDPERLAAEGAALAERTAPVGAVAVPETRADDLKPYLSRIELIALDFPTFKDGRLFSLARRLRDLGFKGEIRAVGHVLPDQAQFLLRCGVSSVEVPDAEAAESFRQQLKAFSVWYQDALDARPTVLELRHGRTRARLAS